mmetsp:Transcript_15873/g.23578  ORF Transcript_15873/g.23578 Transcript_15873/m.23578 type:complete len:145 (+) Transcript_15873:17-451(+)
MFLFFKFLFYFQILSSSLISSFVATSPPFRQIKTIRSSKFEESETIEPNDTEPKRTCPCPDFSQCDGKWRDKGCDGEGRILGGLGAIPLFNWWPIKAYRPCPSFQAAGYAYSRQGQSLNEVVFGSKAADDDRTIFERLEDRGKK